LALQVHRITVIQLKLLGNVDLTTDEGAVSDAPLRRSKRMALLAYLAAARPRGFHRRDKLAALFWPELPTDRARAALRTTLTRLRDDHGTDLILGRGADEIAIDASRLDCDVVEFDAALAAGRFADAAALYRGPFLDGMHVEGTGDELEEWISVERSRLRDAVLRALSALSGAAERRGDLGAALTAAQQALDISGNDEIAARRVIALMIASGNRGGAMRVYDALVRRLRSDFDVEPAAETQALVAPLRERRAVPSDTRATPVAATDAGRIADRYRTPGSPTAVPRRRRAYLMPALALVVLAAGVGWIMTRGNDAKNSAILPGFMWKSVTPSGRAPSGNFGSRAVLDSTGDAMLMFGGVQDVDRQRLVPLGEAYWRLRGFGEGSGASWTRIMTEPGPHPAPRWIFGISSDAAHDRVIVHAGALGFTSPCANDTWVLHHASGIGHVPAWQRVRVRGAAPPGRASFQQVFDASRRRLIVFAGNDCVYPNFHDTWVLAFDDSTLASGMWTQLAPDSSAGIPQRRDAYAATYDTSSGRMFVFGGRASALATDELWALDHADGESGAPAWHPIHCTGDAPVIVDPAGTFDVSTDSWTLFGGMDANGQVTRSVWRVYGLAKDIPHCRWELLVVAEPTPAARSGASAGLLRGSRSMVVFGGEFKGTPLADAWVLRAVRK
jgi:DNA-binding SARP family transcriptional activator